MVLQGNLMKVRAAQITLLLLLLCNTWTELISKALITWLQSCCRPARLILPTYCTLERTLSRTALCSRTSCTHADRAAAASGHRAARLLQLGGRKACPGLMLIITRRAALAGFGSLRTGRITGIHRTRTMAAFSPDKVVFNQPKVR